MASLKTMVWFSMTLAACSISRGNEEVTTQRDVSPACATPIRIKSQEPAEIAVCAIEFVGPSHVYQVPNRKAILNSVLDVESKLSPENSGLAIDIPYVADGQASSSELRLTEVPPELHVDQNAPSLDSSTGMTASADRIQSLQPLLTTEIPLNKHELVEPKRHEIEPAQITGTVNSLAGTPADEPIMGDVTMNFSDSNDPSIDSGASDVAAERTTELLPTLADEIPQSEGLVIHAPMVQPYNRNQHTFVVENKGSNSATDVLVEIRVPKTARIVASLPVNSVFSPSTAVFRFEEIAGGEKVQVHLTAVEKSQRPISFVANVSAKSTYQFAAASDAVGGELGDVTYDLNSSEDSHGPRAATLIKNPFVSHDSDPQQRR